MTTEALKCVLRDLYETHMNSLIAAISTPRRVAVLHVLIDACNGKARHKQLVEKFREVLSASEISRILAKLIEGGLVVKRPDGFFEVTELGKMVGKWLKLFVLWRIKDDPVGREHLKAAFDVALTVFRMNDKKYLADPPELSSVKDFLNRLKSELEKELTAKRPPSPLRVALEIE